MRGADIAPMLRLLYWDELCSLKNEITEKCYLCKERFDSDCENNCRGQYLYEFACLTSGLPKLHWYIMWDYPQSLGTQYLSFFEKFCDNNDRSLFLLGAGETGKSTVAAKIFLQWLGNKTKEFSEISEILCYNLSAYWWDFGDCVGMVKDGVNNQEVKEFVDTVLFDYELIVLDDVGRGYVDSAIVRPYFEKIFKYRFENKKKMIITANLQLGDFDKLFGDKVRSLINQYAEIVPFIDRLI